MDLVQLGLSFAKVGALETRAWLQRTLDHLARAAESLRLTAHRHVQLIL
jgi:hypothetical protein